MPVAVVVGVASSLLLLIVSGIATLLEHVLWTNIPLALGIASHSPLWTVLILTLTGAAVGLVVWKMPGHAGPDPATLGLVEPPMPPAVLPGLLVALILGLAGGVSLGPENPIMAVNTGLVFAIGRQLLPAVNGQAWVALSSAGMIGALFGTPVGAALALTEGPAGEANEPLWNRLFGPLVAAGAGAITTDLLSASSFSLQTVPYRGATFVDLAVGALIGMGAAAIALVATYSFHASFPLFKRIRNPLLMLTTGGFILGVVGVVGGPLTLFKGLDEVKQLTDNVAQYSAGDLALMTLAKTVALVVAATCGFRGGRIFPSVFIGAAFGLCITALIPGVQEALAIACGVLGVVMVVTRQGWISLFTAAVLVPDTRLVPVLVLVSLPVWLLAVGRPLMQINKR